MRKLFILPFLMLLPFTKIAHAQRIYGVTEVGTPEITPSFFAAPPPDRPSMPDVRDTKTVAMTAAGVVEIGEPDMNVQFVKHSGIDKTLTEALREILPKDWHAKKKLSVNRYLRISWNKGMDWIRVLNDVAIEYRLAISVDWDNKTVTILNQYHDVPSISAPTENNKVFTVSEAKWEEIKPKPGAKDILPVLPVKKIDAPIKPIAAAPLPPPIKLTPSLRLTSGLMLDKCVEAWVKEIGWNYVWNAKNNYLVSVNSTFAGSSIEEIATNFERSLQHNKFKLHVEGHNLSTTIEVVDTK